MAKNREKQSKQISWTQKAGVNLFEWLRTGYILYRIFKDLFDQ